MVDLGGPASLAASLVLVAAAVGLSLWRRLDLHRPIITASARAAVQMVAVGALLMLIADADNSGVWAGVWVVAMVVIAAEVVQRRVGRATPIRGLAALATGGSMGLSLLVVFGFGVVEPEPLAVVVVAGIAMGNTLPAAVLAARHTQDQMAAQRNAVEGLLALGFDRAQVARFVVRETGRTALIPQIERTRVVGLIALPGAMTGLVLAGVDPLDAAVLQLVVMYLVLGSVAVSVVVVALGVARRSLTPDLRLT